MSLRCIIKGTLFFFKYPLREKNNLAPNLSSVCYASDLSPIFSAGLWYLLNKAGLFNSRRPTLAVSLPSKHTGRTPHASVCSTVCSTYLFSSVQLLSRVWLFATPWTAARQASLSITNTRNLLKLMSIELVMASNHLILCRPHLLPPSIFPSIRVFSNKPVLHIRWPKNWSCSFSISPSSEYLGLISFRIDWLDLLAVWGTFKSLLQNHSSKPSILQCSASFRVGL